VIAAIAFLGAALGALGARMAFIRQGADRRVDHHYWLVVAQALRADPRLPPIIRGRYLLEDERQSYPPFFAWFLSWFRPEFLERRAVGLSQIADLGLIGVLIVFGVVSGVTGWAMAIGAAVIGLAPVLVAYNVQVNPRSWGNLFLSVKLMAEVLAVGMAGSYEIAFWAVAIAATAGVILSHKMSTQFMLALWPAWAIVLGSWAVATIPLFGLIVATAITGPTFARLQWRSHADIVRFWHRHWRNLGAHAVRQSPIYGSPGGPDGRFHGQGLRGVVQHLKNVVAYLPLGVLAPVVLFIAPAPPAWLLAWFAGAYAMALLTLFVPFLKCFGGGHHYVFNAVLPAVLWWMLAVETGDPVVQALLAIGLIVTLAALVLGWRQRAGRGGTSDPDLAAARAALAKRSRAPIAVFPLVTAEVVASDGRNPVLWGGHGYGFRLLEPIFPVVSAPLGATLRGHGTGLVLWDSTYWPGADAVLRDEARVSHVESFGRWRLAEIPRSTPSRHPSVMIVVRSLGIGGTERHLAQVVPQLAGRGLPIEVVTLHPGGAMADRLRAQGIKVYEADRRRGTVSAFVWLWRLLTVRRPAIAHFFLPEAYLVGAIAAIVADVPSLLMSRRSLNYYHRKHPFLAHLEKALHRRMTTIVGNSDAVLADLRNEGVPVRRVRKILNGIDLSPYANANSRDRLRSELSIARDSVVLIIVANLIPYKGHADLIDALSRRAHDLPADWRLLCVGRDTGIRDGLQQRARDGMIGDHILWLGERADVPDLLASADIAISTSHEEGSSNAIIEAMAAGLPVVATEAGGNRELVIDGWNGALVGVGDTEALAAQLVALAHDEFRRKAMGEIARAEVERNYTLDRCVDEYLALYDEVYLPGAHAAQLAQDQSPGR